LECAEARFGKFKKRKEVISMAIITVIFSLLCLVAGAVVLYRGGYLLLNGNATEPQALAWSAAATLVGLWILQHGLVAFGLMSPILRL
jgi:hypothetical protein